MAVDQVIFGAREVVSVPLFADFTLPKTSKSPCISVPTLKGVSDDTGSRNMDPGPGVLKGVFVIVSSCLRKEGRTKEAGVAKEMGLGVGPDGGVGNSLIYSAISSSGPVCMVSIRAVAANVTTSNVILASSSNSLTTSSTNVSTTTSLTGPTVPAMRVLGEWGGSGLAGASSFRVGSEGPG